MAVSPPARSYTYLLNVLILITFVSRVKFALSEKPNTAPAQPSLSPLSFYHVTRPWAETEYRIEDLLSTVTLHLSISCKKGKKQCS